MIYPDFLNDNATIGICAPSAGVGHKLESFDASLRELRKQGWKVWETEHVRVDSLRGGNAKERANELMSLFALDSIDAVFAAAGGDFLSDILPYIDWQLLAENPKWLMGASDPTGILYPVTTMCDIATLYGSNGGSFDTTVLRTMEQPSRPMKSKTEGSLPGIPSEYAPFSEGGSSGTENLPGISWGRHFPAGRWSSGFFYPHRLSGFSRIPECAGALHRRLHRCAQGSDRNML